MIRSIETDNATQAATSPTGHHMKPAIFWLLVLLLLTGGIIRSNWATRLDSYTLDEAYHIMAGASYAKTGSFRINPEHPPLTKLWVGAVVLFNGYKLAPFKPLSDKNDERNFAEKDVYQNNNPEVVQQQARMAMFALNGLLLILFTVLLRRTLGPIVALITLAYLLIDPTVAAHLPVVMTDLPVALASGSAMLAAVIAFRSWRPADLLLAVACLGLALAAKHSATITGVAVGLLGVTMALVGKDDSTSRATFSRIQRLGLVAVVLMGAVVVLWGFYGFRYRDSPEVGEFFNRPLTAKIDDIRSPLYKTLLHEMADAHLLPASYLWGLADTIRAGIEGRASSIYAFGQLYFNRAPFYYAPGIWAAKLPIGLLLLTLFGLFLLVFRQLLRSSLPSLAGLAVLTGLVWLALATGSTYGGVRHALAILPLLAVLGALAVATAFRNGSGWLQSRWVRGLVGVAGLVALVEAGPVVRPWEYFNGLAGGSANSYQYFNDEGVDLFQRSGELIRYYKKHLEPTGEIPFIWYQVARAEKKRYGIHWVGEDPIRDSIRYQLADVSGTFFLSSMALSPSLYGDEAEKEVFRKAKPIARMGNLLVYRGTFRQPTLRADWLASQGFKAIYVDPKPDTTKAIRFMAQAVALYPKVFFVDWELGNLYARRGARQQAVHAFELARTYCPDEELKKLLSGHINQLKTADLRKLPTLRNPGME